MLELKQGLQVGWPHYRVTKSLRDAKGVGSYDHASRFVIGSPALSSADAAIPLAADG